MNVLHDKLREANIGGSIRGYLLQNHPQWESMLKDMNISAGHVHKIVNRQDYDDAVILLKEYKALLNGEAVHGRRLLKAVHTNEIISGEKHFGIPYPNDEDERHPMNLDVPGKD